MLITGSLYSQISAQNCDGQEARTTVVLSLRLLQACRHICTRTRLRS